MFSSLNEQKDRKTKKKPYMICSRLVIETDISSYSSASSLRKAILASGANTLGGLIANGPRVSTPNTSAFGSCALSVIQDMTISSPREGRSGQPRSVWEDRAQKQNNKQDALCGSTMELLKSKSIAASTSHGPSFSGAKLSAPPTGV